MATAGGEIVCKLWSLDGARYRRQRGCKIMRVMLGDS